MGNFHYILIFWRQEIKQQYSAMKIIANIESKVNPERYLTDKKMPAEHIMPSGPERQLYRK